MKAIMLRTDNVLETKGLLTSDGKWFSNGSEIGCFIDNDTDIIQHHIYIVDETAEIKGGDWFMANGHDESFPLQAENSDVLLKGINVSDFYKIVASTDTLEGIPILSGSSINSLIWYYKRYGKMPSDIVFEKAVVDVAIPTKETVLTWKQAELMLSQFICEHAPHTSSELNAGTYLNNWIKTNL